MFERLNCPIHACGFALETADYDFISCSSLAITREWKGYTHTEQTGNSYHLMYFLCMRYFIDRKDWILVIILDFSILFPLSLLYQSTNL